MTTQIPRLRTSERIAFKRCQARWKWGYLDGLKLIHEKPGALWFGIGMHRVWEERYKYKGLKRGKNVLQVWRDYVGDEQAVVYDENYATDPTAFYNAKELGEQMIGAYLDKYGKDENWYVLGTEIAFEIAIPRPIRVATGKTRPGPLVNYLGAFDLVARNLAQDDVLMLWDHKHVGVIQTQHLSLDDQAGSYWALAAQVLVEMGIVPEGTVLDGILYNFLRKAKPDTRPVDSEGRATNKPTKAHYLVAMPDATDKLTLAGLEALAVSKGLTVVGDPSARQPSPNFLREEVWRTRKEMRSQIRKIQNEALQMEAVRNRVLPITKNPTKDCTWDCSFFQMCELHESGDDWKEYKNLAYVKSDPYGDHYATKETENA